MSDRRTTSGRNPRLIVLALLLLAVLVAAWWFAGGDRQVLGTATGQQSNGSSGAAATPTKPAPRPTSNSGSEPQTTDTTIPGVPAGAERAKVLWVHDGDTLHVSTTRAADLTIRLIGIDTPEIGDNAECWGVEATDAARSLMPKGAVVWLVIDRDPQDKYGRQLRYLYTDDGVFVNLRLVTEGDAEAIRVGANDAFWPQLRAAQREAERAGLGMWGACTR